MASSSDGTALPANRDGGGAEQSQDQLVKKPSQEEFDYEIWREGTRTTHVKCFSNTGRPSDKASGLQRHRSCFSDADMGAQSESSGMYTQYIKLESPFPFHVLHTETFEHGPMTGCQAITIRPEVPFPFLELPREIRDEIYAYAMVQGVYPWTLVAHEGSNDGIIRFEAHGPSNQRSYKQEKPLRVSNKISEHRRRYLRQRQSLTPGLLTTSRQIYHESVQTLYGANEFEIDARYALPFILDQFGDCSRLLRSLQLDGFWERHDIGRYLEPLVRLQNLSIDMPWRVYKPVNGPEHVADVFFDKTYRWIRGVASVHGDETYAANCVSVYCDEFCVLRCGNMDPDYRKECLMIDSFRSELKATILARKGSSFPFMKLPRKVRDAIYRHAMVYKPFDGFEETSIDFSIISLDESNNPMRTSLYWHSAKSRPGGLRYAGFRWSESLTPGLLRVNRRIYQECNQILYGKNRFHLEDSEAAKIWLDRIGNSHVYLRDVDISLLPDDRTILHKLLHVDRLSFRISRSYSLPDSQFCSPEKEAETFFALASHWIEGVGSFRGGRAAAIDRIHPYAPISPADEEEQWVSRFRAELKKICG